MVIRKLAFAGAVVSLIVAASGAGAGADTPTSLVAKPFSAAGTIFNDNPPFRPYNTDFRFYFEGDNFTLNPVTSATPRAARVIDSSGTLGIRTLPTTEYYLNGDPTDFAGAIVEGCTTEVEGYAFNVPTQVSRDDLRATKVHTTC